MSTILNQISGLVVGQYGEGIILTIADDNAVPVDISTYTGLKELILRSPDELKTLTYSISFNTDGTDGKIVFVPLIGDIDRPGVWHGQIILVSATAKIPTQIFTVKVSEAL